MGIVVSILLGYAPERSSASLRGGASSLSANAPHILLDETPTPTATTTMLAMVGEGTPVATLLPSPTPTRFVSPTPFPRLYEDHYLLERPIDDQFNDWTDRFYPYASRGDGTYPVHHGVEFVNTMGTQVLATGPGTIVVAGDDSRQVYGARTDFYGNLVIEKLDVTYQGQPIFVLCGHLSEVAVTEGQRVETGDVLGRVGMTGIAQGPHVHVEVRFGGNNYDRAVNPELWLRPQPDTGTLAAVVLNTDGLPVPDVRVIIARASRPNVMVRELYTYPGRDVRPDPSWGENLVTGSLEAGKWVAQVFRSGTFSTTEFSIVAGTTTWLEIHVAK